MKKSKRVYVKSDRLDQDLTPEEQAKAINEMSEAIVDGIFGKDFGKAAKEKLRKKYEINPKKKETEGPSGSSDKK